MFFAVVVVAGLLLVDGHGVQGLAIAVALGTAACNVPRLVEVVRALRGPWGEGARRAPAPATARRATALRRHRRRARRSTSPPTFGALDGVPGIGGLLLVVGTVALTFAVALREARRRSHGSWRFVAISPLAGGRRRLGLIFGLRPLELWLSPRDTTLALTALGFSSTDLVHAAAIGALGCAAWALGYLVMLGRPPRPQPLADRRAPSRCRSAPLLGLLALSCVLWGALFVRQGGLATLVDNPGELHNDGAVERLRGPRHLAGPGGRAVRPARAAATAGAAAPRGCARSRRPSPSLRALALQARGLLVLGVRRGADHRPAPCGPRGGGRSPSPWSPPPSPCRRSSSCSRSAATRSRARPAEAVRLALKTPLATQQISDLGVFDNLVALQQLVPDSAARLDGASLVAIPTAFVPRGLWPGKPQPVDQQMSALVYPGLTAGTPVALQGELWWNFGVAGVALGAVAIGLLMGLLARLAFTARSPLALLLYAVATASVVAPLTRALAPMTTNTALALAGDRARRRGRRSAEWRRGARGSGGASARGCRTRRPRRSRAAASACARSTDCAAWPRSRSCCVTSPRSSTRPTRRRSGSCRSSSASPR